MSTKILFALDIGSYSYFVSRSCIGSLAWRDLTIFLERKTQRYYNLSYFIFLLGLVKICRLPHSQPLVSRSELNIFFPHFKTVWTTEKIMQLKHLIATFTVFLLVYTCNCYKHDERFVSSENMTILELMTRTMDLSYFKIPSIDKSENGSCARTLLFKWNWITFFPFTLSLSIEYIKRLAPKILEHQKPFVLLHDGISERCRRDSQKFLSSLKKFDLWALKSEKIFVHLQIEIIKSSACLQCMMQVQNYPVEFWTEMLIDMVTLSSVWMSLRKMRIFKANTVLRTFNPQLHPTSSFWHISGH